MLLRRPPPQKPRPKGSLGNPDNSRTATGRALTKALQGIRVAFPEEMASKAIREALEAAIAQCANTFFEKLEDITKKDAENLRDEIHGNILEALHRGARIHHGEDEEGGGS